MFVLEGVKLCEEAKKSGISIRSLYYTQRALDLYKEKLSPILPICSETCEISDSVAEKMGDTGTPSGIFAVCQLPKQASASERDIYIALENLQDPGNVGTIIRTAEAFGAGVALVGGVDVYSPKVLRSSAGSVLRVPVSAYEDIGVLKSDMTVRDLPLFGAALRGDSVSLSELPRRVCVLVGNEGAGLSEAALAACDGVFTIPMQGAVESLNAAVCAAIILYALGGGV